LSDNPKKEVDKLVDHLFRHESGKMVSVLTRVFGFKNMEQAEDIVQDTIIRALETWKYGKVPDNPQAWLYRTAKNKAIDLIRRQQVKHKIESELAPLLKSEYTLVPAMREMFACCNDLFTPEAQITLTLKTLCGLSVKEIAGAFLSNEETITKRLYRTREKIKMDNLTMDYPGAAAMPERTDTVLKTLYLLFNEGYNSSHPEKLIREDLCEEAMRLCILLTENPKTNLPQTNALLALMCYHISRFNTRLDDKGFIVLLKDQDRKQWNKYLINKGNEYMQHAAKGVTIHEFHIEAAIASVHANAATYEDTNWQMILQLYDSLLQRTHNPVVELNRCVVIGEIDGPEAAIDELLQMKGLEANCYYNTALAEMYLRANHKPEAQKLFETALLLTASHAESELIIRKIRSCI